MASKKLTALQVTQLTVPGMYADGDGLYLLIKPNGTKFWIFRYQLNKRRREMGLKAFNKKTNSLADARVAAAEKRLLVEKGIDPIDQAKEETERQKREQELKALEAAQKEAQDLNTFKACAEEYIKNKSPEWKNAKHKDQWTNTLKAHVYPVIGDMPVNDIEVEHVRQCLNPIWLDITETATRVRQRIEAVISSAIASKQRDPAKGNPAIWKGLLENFYPNPEKVKRNKHLEAGTDGHFAAMSYEDMPEFMTRLVKLNGYAPLALRFLILTVPRTTELRLAEWDEIDFDKKMWVIPAGRMKASKQHRIPLSDAAIELLENLPRREDNQYIFPGWKRGSPLSNNGLLDVLRKMGVPKEESTVHGLRSSFRDYIGEETGFPERLAEYALAHQLTDEAEKAYARGDKLKKRFAMMNAWASFVDSKLGQSKVTPFRRRAKG